MARVIEKSMSFIADKFMGSVSCKIVKGGTAPGGRLDGLGLLSYLCPLL